MCIRDRCKASDFARLYGDKTEIQKIGKFKTDKTFQADEPGTLLIKRYCTKHEDFCTALEALDCNIDIVAVSYTHLVVRMKFNSIKPQLSDPSDFFHRVFGIRMDGPKTK